MESSLLQLSGPQTEKECGTNVARQSFLRCKKDHFIKPSCVFYTTLHFFYIGQEDSFILWQSLSPFPWQWPGPQQVSPPMGPTRRILSSGELDKTHRDQSCAPFKTSIIGRPVSPSYSTTSCSSACANILLLLPCTTGRLPLVRCHV